MPVDSRRKDILMPPVIVDPKRSKAFEPAITDVAVRRCRGRARRWWRRRWRLFPSRTTISSSRGVEQLKAKFFETNDPTTLVVAPRAIARQYFENQPRWFETGVQNVSDPALLRRLPATK